MLRRSTSKIRKRIILAVAIIVTLAVGVKTDQEISIVKKREVKHIIDQVNLAKWQLRNEIITVEKLLRMASNFAEQRVITPAKGDDVDRIAMPFLNSFDRLKTFIVADTDGNEYAITKEKRTWLSSYVNLSNEKKGENKIRWIRSVEGKRNIVSQWNSMDTTYDPRQRPWFQSALCNSIYKQINWSEPYIFHTQRMPGITASVKCTKTQPVMVIAIDVLLSDLTKFTMGFSKNRDVKLFILTKDLQFLGVPKTDDNMTNKEINSLLLKDYRELNRTYFTNAIDHWTANGDDIYSPFSYRSEGDRWWGQITPFNLEGNKYLLIGLITPESELHSSINFIRIIAWVIVCAFILVLLRSMFRK